METAVQRWYVCFRGMKKAAGGWSAALGGVIEDVG